MKFRIEEQYRIKHKILKILYAYSLKDNERADIDRLNKKINIKK